MSPHFTNFSAIIIRHLREARSDIRIAICWFSNPAIFETLLERLRAGVRVELILEYDAQNFRVGGLDFRRFIRLGGLLYGYRGAELMHHKFAVVDTDTVLTGSFNWTNSSNAENLLSIRDEAVAAAYLEEFSRVKAISMRVLKIRCELLKPFAAYPLFENTRFRHEDVRLRISLGAALWRVPAGYPGLDREHVWQSPCLYIDPEGMLLGYWRQFPGFDFNHMKAYLEASEVTPETLRSLRVPVLRMKKGDLILVEQKTTRLLGIVQSDLQSSRHAGFGGEREIQWLRLLEANQILKGKESKIIRQFRGNRLALVDAFYAAE